MKKKYQSVLPEASAKATETKGGPGTLPLLELLVDLKAEIEAASAQWGLAIMTKLMEREIEELCGKWGAQPCYRHGRQPGYVIYAGRKAPLTRPRVRRKGGGEGPLQSYQAFQAGGRLRKAVARQLLRKVSTRDYAGAIDQCLEGYGIGRSSVSREWKAATSAELEKLCQRPVPQDLVALLIDSKYLRQECLVVALGVDRQGGKHVLGLWHGATENGTVVKALLADLQERGLSPEAALLVVLDGARALHRAVKDVLGDRAVIQRCRVHKLRNVMEHLPKEKRQQVLWRLRAAWAKPKAEEALQALRQVGVWLGRGFVLRRRAAWRRGWRKR